MIRTLLATTAVAAVLALPVIAQDASSSMESSMMDSTMSSSMMDSSMMSSAPMDASSSMMDSSMMSSAPMDASSSMMDSSSAPMDQSSMMSSEMPMDTSSSMMSSEQGGGGGFDVVTGYTQIDSDRFASRIIGAGVYDSGAGDANHLGDISDLVVNETGDIVAVIIGVGGFLGIGEKQVAVSYDALQWVVAEDETERFVVETTVDELNAAPDFVVVEDDPAEGSSAEAVTSEPVESAPAEGDAMAPAPAEGDAMATSSVAQ